MINGWKRLAAIAALVLVGAATLLLGFTGAAVSSPSASPSGSPAVSGTASASSDRAARSAFCGKDDHYEYKPAGNGGWLQCVPVNGGLWQWQASSAPPTKASSSKPVVPADARPEGELALTGVPVGLLAAGGGGLLAIGIGVVLLARRDRRRFSA